MWMRDGPATARNHQNDMEDDSHSVKGKRLYAVAGAVGPMPVVAAVDMRLASTYVPAVAGLLRSSLLILLISR